MNSFMESDGPRNMEVSEEEQEDDERRVMSMIVLHSAPFPFPQKMNFPDLCSHFSAVAWCPKSNIIACATETCARDPGSGQQPAFWVPVHVLDPERPTEHAIFNVTADSPCDVVQFLEWSPLSCPGVLLVGNIGGRVTIWSQPTHGTPNVAHTVNCWSCEHEWRQEQAVTIKWVTGLSPYRWSSTTSTGTSSSKSFEEKFLAHVPRPQGIWPNFLCVCSIAYSGCVQLHWRQWPSHQPVSSSKWFSTDKAVLGAGPSGLFAADTIVTDTGSLIVAGAPVGTPSTVIVWEISPWVVNPTAGNTQSIKYGMPVQPSFTFGPPSWPGLAPLAAYLMSWQEQQLVDNKSGQPHVETEEKTRPLLHCSPISNLSAYVTPEASTLTSWGSGVAGIAFDPSRGGSALITLICEGYFISPEAPDDGPSLTGWRFQRWESAQQPVPIHPLFETGNPSYPTSSHPMITSWTAVSSKVMSPRANNSCKSVPGNLLQTESWRRPHLIGFKERPENPRCIAKITFSAHGGEYALTLASGEVHVFSGSSVTPIDSFMVRTYITLAPSVAFSPTSCSLASVWHDKKTDCSVLKLLCLDPCTNQGNIAAALIWERHLADRFWWSLMSGVDWWDIIACTQYVVDECGVTVPRLAAVLDADFHALPTSLHRQQYSIALDRIKCRMMEGIEAADVRALVLDMQARLLLDVLGKGIEAALINPSTLVAEPWLASSETLSSLGVDAMSVDVALVHNIQAYVDSILDLSSHFLTRLRRYASFCRTLASHSVANNSAANNNRPGVNSSNGGTFSMQAGQATQSGSSSTTGSTGMQAWVQSVAIAQIKNNAESATSNAPSTGIGSAAPLTVSTATFPGIPAVRLIGDCQFLHRLCQLLFFCLIFRKRQTPRYVTGPRMSAEAVAAAAAAKGVANLVPKTEDMSGANPGSRSTSVLNVKLEDGTRSGPSSKPDEAQNPRSIRVGSGNAGQGYTSEEVKYLFLVLVDLCKRTSSHPHPVPKSQVGSNNPIMRLHYVDGQYSVMPEVVEASLGPHMQQLPRPRGADAAGLLMRELELHPPAEEWNRKNTSFSRWSSDSSYDLEWLEEEDQYIKTWPRKRRFAERDAAFGFRTAVGLGSFAGFMGSRRDVITGVWKAAQHGVWHKCLRCGRQTASLSSPMSVSSGSVAPSPSRESWWTGRWAFGCPMCGGRWARML